MQTKWKTETLVWFRVHYVLKYIEVPLHQQVYHTLWYVLGVLNLDPVIWAVCSNLELLFTPFTQNSSLVRVST